MVGGIPSPSYIKLKGGRMNPWHSHLEEDYGLLTIRTVISCNTSSVAALSPLMQELPLKILSNDS